MITSHVWRPPVHTYVRVGCTVADLPCEFMNCRRPRAEHERSVGALRRWPDKRTGEGE